MYTLNCPRWDKKGCNMVRFRYVPFCALSLFFAGCAKDFDQFSACPKGEHPRNGSCVPDGSTGGSAGSGASAGSGGSSTGGVGGTTGSGGATTTSTSGSGGCDAGSKDCDGSCVPLNDPNTHCGDVGVCTPCIDPQYHIVGVCNGDGTCSSGSCVSGWGECDSNPATGCETDLMNNMANCGSCGNACQSDQVCDQNKCVPLCGTQSVPVSGYAACLVLDSNTLSVGTFATMTVKVGAPALSGPSDPVDCISPVAASLNNGTDASVLCSLPGLMPGMSIDMALKSYSSGDLVAANPPLPFAAFKCANGLDATLECTAPVRIYKDGLLVATYASPVMPPFSYVGVGMNAPIQLVYAAQ